MCQLSGWGVAVSLLLNLCLAGSVTGQSYGLDTRAPISAFLGNKFPTTTPGAPSGGWTAVDAFPNLTFDDPITLIPEKGSTRLYITGRQGTIHFVTNNPATTVKSLFLDLTSVTQGYDDCGLVGMAFHPEFGQAGSANRGYFYVYYQYSPSPVIPAGGGRPPSATAAYNRLSRFTVPDGWFDGPKDPAQIRATELVLINQFDQHVWHNGGAMFFGDDGFLYLTNGDEGASNDSYNNTQKINDGLFSGVLRIDVNQDPTKSHPIRRQPLNGGTVPGGWPNSFTTNYFIPNDNPWLDAGGSVLEEFYAIGLRSPHRMTFDSVENRIWLGDVGQGTWEEVDIIQKGGNYQWAYQEGAHAGPKAKPATIIGVDKPPIYDYNHSTGNTCIIGGYVYRGTQFPELIGKYIFGDNTSSRIWSITYDGINPPVVTQMVQLPWSQNYSGLAGFGLDQNNEILLCRMGRPSKIYRLARLGTPVADPPAILSQIGVFTNLTTLATTNGVLPFQVNSPLWSDAAVKSRWMAVPNDGAPYTTNETIGFNATGEWVFPSGTVFIKHFELPVNDTNPSIRKRLETRFLVRDTNGTVYGVTYKWRADNSDADLLTNGLNEDITIQTATGTRTQTWYYPSRSDCITCHNPNAGHVLGVKTRQLNGDITYPSTGVTDNQLRALNHVGLFNPVLSEAAIPGYDKTVAVTNTAAPIEQRIRSYIDSNCSQCHRPNGVQAYFDARFDTPLTSQDLINGAVGNSLGITGARVIAPQSLAQSIMHLRVNSLDAIKMPPLAKNVIDTNAVAALAEWINSLPAPAVLPTPWLHLDLGVTGVAGDATYMPGTFTVSGSGADIWNNADAFHYAYRPWTGDGEVVARVATVQNTDGWAKAGVMFREALTEGSRHSLMSITPGNGSAFQRRTTTDGASTHTAGTVVAAPYWVRLVRSGNLFTGYISNNGSTWTSVASETIAMSTTIYVGLALTAHNNTVLNTSTFSNVRVVSPGEKAVPIISWNNPSGLTYGAPLTSTQLNAAADVPGVFAYSPTSGTVLNAGNAQPLSVTFTPTDTANYSNTTASVVINVGKSGTAGLVTSSTSLSQLGQTVTFTATLTAVSPGVGTPAGSVQFKVDGVAAGSPAALSGGVASVGINSIAAGNHVVTAEYAGNGNFFGTTNTLSGGLVVNAPPTVGADTLQRYAGYGVKVQISTLLANDTDSDGDPVVFQSVTNQSTGGGTVLWQGGWIHYTPPAGPSVTDTFAYTVQDTRGGTNTGVITVQIKTDDAPTQNVAAQNLGNGSYRVRAYGIPGLDYLLQYSASLVTPNWLPLTTNSPGPLGFFEFVDSPDPVPPTRFYRSVLASP